MVASTPSVISPVDDATALARIRLSPEVAHALSSNQPVVALESTIIAHGMPYPSNLSTAHLLESTVRAAGAVPATVAVLSGVPHVGLTSSELALLASPSPSRPVRKLARRDLPLAYALRQTGATTVSATMAISAAAGVPVFATGGIGGVHRRVDQTWDISADIPALASISQLVVCAGAKSILDLPKTLEALETASVPVLVLQSTTFPAFYTAGSLPAPATVPTERDAARVFHAAREADAPHGVLLAVPVPQQRAADAAIIDRATAHALHELENHDPPILPKQVTPFLLRRISELTNGASLQANIALARNNVAVAARVAVALCDLCEKNRLTKTGKPQVLVVGGVALDVHCDALRGAEMKLGASNKGRIRQCAGGVAKNVAEAATRLGGVEVRFVSAVGDDVAGEVVLRWMRGAGMNITDVKVIPGRRTAACCIVHDDKGDLAVAIGDMDDIFSMPSQSLISQSRKRILEALQTVKLVCLDGNLSVSDISALSTMCKQHSIPCWFEPTTPQKCVKIVASGALHDMRYLSPNEVELQAITRALRCESNGSLWQNAENVLRRGRGGERGQRLLVTRGVEGISRFTLEQGGNGWCLVEKVFKSIRVDNVGNTTGAGDSFAGRCIAALASGLAEDEAIRLGLQAAADCCREDVNVSGGRARM